MATATATGTAMQQVYISKTTTLHVHHAFLYVPYLSLHDCDIKLPNFMRPLYGVGEQNRKLFFSLTQMWSFQIQPQKISPTFQKLNEIK